MAKKKSSKSSTGDKANGPVRNLVIVESPAKAKTINRYLGSDYIVKASKGHVRDLPPHSYGIDPVRNFEPNYEILADHRKIITELKQLADGAETVYLATDLDREGEAIAWHLKHALELPDSKVRRVVFNEITKSAIADAFSRPSEINQAKVDAQQARRVLDRIVGYELSPLLWKKISKGLSAGRVQSVAVRLIVIREQEIRAFEPQEYWEMAGAFALTSDAARDAAKGWKEFCRAGGKESEAPSQKERYAWLTRHDAFEASLAEFAGATFKPAGTLDPAKAPGSMFQSAVAEVRPIAEALGVRVENVVETPWEAYERFGLRKIVIERAAGLESPPVCTVTSVETKRTTSKAPAPFTTATLQQAASNALRFNTSRTMRVAQGLYEGVDLKTSEGSVGLITYMRTDSKNLSADSVNAAREFIAGSYGDRYLPEKPNRYLSV